MKRGLISILLFTFMVLIASCSRTIINKINPPVDAKIIAENKQQAPPPSVITEEEIKGVSLLYNKNIDIEYLNSLGFNTAFMAVNGVRIPSPPYRTDFKVVRGLEYTLQSIKSKNINYIIDITSGPGYSQDENISSIFENRQEAMYYAQMVRETIKMHIDNPNFKGVALSFETPEVSQEKYYETLRYILSKVREDYPDVNIVVDLHPLSFENGISDISNINLEKVTININLKFNYIDYPGNATGYGSSFEINRNSILSSLQILKKNLEAKDSHVIVTIKSPWKDNSEVFLQDIFEIIRMLDFEFNIEYGNSQDIYDFKNTESIIKIIKRHSS